LLEKLQKLALLLSPLKLAALLGVPVFAVLFLLGLMNILVPDNDGFLIVTALATLWCLTLVCCITGFRSVPARAGQGASWLTRLKLRCRRAGYWLLAWLAILTTAALLVMTLRFVLMLVRG